jgi:multidrug efflux pump
VPIGLNNSSAGEYTFTLFAVIAVAMLVSWVVAVLFAPVLGVHILSAKVKPKPEKPGRLAHAFIQGMLWCMRHRWLTIGATVLMFVLSVFGMGLVQNQFFPSSDRPEILVDLNLPQNASIAETLKVTQRFEESLKGDPDIVRWSSTSAKGAIRFYLPLDQQLQNPFYAQLVIVSKGPGEPRCVDRARLEQTPARRFCGRRQLCPHPGTGASVGQPLQYRVSGPNIDQVRKHAIDLATLLDANTNVGEIIFNWNEPGKVLRIDIAQDKARQYGLSSEDVARVMNSIVSGAAVSQVKDDIYLINIVGRAVGTERGTPETLLNLQITTPSGTSIPLLAFATVRYELEQPLVWSRDRIPTLTLKASVRGSMQPTDLVKPLKPDDR